MKKCLIDTHTLLWASENSDNLSLPAKEIIDLKSNIILISIVSFWEIAIKVSLGKLQTNIPLNSLKQYLGDTNYSLLHISFEALNRIKSMPFYHRDPFDRMLIAQAITENIPIVSVDTKFDLYPEIQRIW